MNHYSELSINTILSASESECSYRLAVNSNRNSVASSRREACEKFSDNAAAEHVYENIVRLKTNNKSSKLQTLNNLIVKLGLKTRDIPKMLKINNNQQQLAVEEKLDDFGELFDDFFQEFDDGSYTSCFEENIYEDLDFYSCTSNNEESLSAWLRSISSSCEEYDDSDDECDLMIHKSIPYRRRKKSTRQLHSSMPHSAHLDGSTALSLFELRKLEIIKKCLVAIWYQESESGVLKNLFLILKEIFTDYLRRETPKTSLSITSTHNSDDAAETKMTSVRASAANSMTKCENETSALEMNTRAFDKTKLEHLILSMSLNKRLITYDKNLKIILTLKSSPCCWFSREKVFTPSVITAAIEWKKEGSNENLEKCHSNVNHVDKANEESKTVLHSEICDVNDDDSHNISNIPENIYESIWQCTNIGGSQQANDDETKECYIECNNDWEIDSEFSFKETYDSSQLKMPFRDVIIYYKDVPKNDKICVASTTTFNPVENWKNIIKTVSYADDEEEMYMSEYQMISLSLLEDRSYHNTMTSSNQFDESREVYQPSGPSGASMIDGIKHEDVKNASDHSIDGKYRTLNDTDSFKSNGSDISVTSSEQPTRERERFRDKLKNKLRIKTSSAKDSGPKENDLPYIDVDLEKVEVHQAIAVPKIVFHICEMLEDEVNIKTSGLYRVSGNKTVIDTLKKRLNSSKKKSDNIVDILRSQDVHTIAGLLKMFIRELQPPLVPAQIFDNITENQCLIEIKTFLREMTKLNYETLKFLIAHLCKVEKEKERNLMTSGNLAICWGLCLFSKSVSSNFYVENEISKCNVMCKTLIDHYDEVFSN